MGSARLCLGEGCTLHRSHHHLGKQFWHAQYVRNCRAALGSEHRRAAFFPARYGSPTCSALLHPSRQHDSLATP